MSRPEQTHMAVLGRGRRRPYIGMTLSSGAHVTRAVLARTDETLATLSRLPEDPDK